MKFTIVIPGAPRTAKNSPMIIRGIKHPVLLPSPAYREWTQHVLSYRDQIRSHLASLIPIVGPVSMQALIYRESLTGDAVGYYQAIADVLQSQVWSCESCKRKTPEERPSECRHCGCFALKLTRKGLGIIEDDKLIMDWDGSRLMKDAQRPRVELTIRTLAQEIQADMFSKEVEV